MLTSLQKKQNARFSRRAFYKQLARFHLSRRVKRVLKDSGNKKVRTESSEAIWATNIRYLNDVLERRHFLSLIHNHLGLSSPNALNDELLGLLSDEIANNSKSFIDLPFVASFSGDRDYLPQWRSYCPQGNGVCIGFRTDSLLNAFVDDQPGTLTSDMLHMPPSVSFEAVRYLRADDIDAVNELFQQAVIEGKKGQAAVHDQGFTAEITGMTEADFVWTVLSERASRIKHASFASEKEYRLTVITTSGFDDRFRTSRSTLISFRTSRSTLIPYIAVKVPDPADFLSATQNLCRIPDQPPFHKPSFIDSVTIGPTPELNLSEDALHGFFAQGKLGVLVHKSTVPFRDL